MSEKPILITFPVDPPELISLKDLKSRRSIITLASHPSFSHPPIPSLEEYNKLLDSHIALYKLYNKEKK